MKINSTKCLVALGIIALEFGFLGAIPESRAQVALVPTSAPANKPALPEQVRTFAGVEATNVSLSKPGAFAPFDAAFYENELFLLGEAHGVQRPQQIDLALFQHLNERAGVRTYLAEVDCVKAYYLNEYLRTGEEATLKLVFRSWERETAQWANKDFFSKLQKLQQWNATLPKSRRMRFLGLDELQDLPLVGDYMAALVARKQLSPALRPPVDSMVLLLRQPDATTPLAAIATRALQEMSRQQGTGRNQLGGAYDDLMHLLRNIADRRQGMAQREKNIFANFERLYRAQHLQGEKMYGFWGMGHVLQSPLEGGTTEFAALVRQSSLPVHTKVVSLLCVFSGCQMLMTSSFLPEPWQTPGQRYSQTNKFNHDGPLVKIEGMEELKGQTVTGSTTLFTLNGRAAVTNQQAIGIRYAPGVPPGQQIRFDPALPATAYAQYLILVRNSPAVVPLMP